MLERKGFMPINYLKKENYTGSYRGMRYKMAKEKVKADEEEKEVLRVYHWPEPYSFEATGDELKTWMDTSFDEEGIVNGIHWLNEAYLACYQETSRAERENPGGLR